MNRPRNIEVRKIALVSSAIFLALFTAWFLLGGAWSDTANDDMGSAQPSEFKFETVTGIFMQDDPETEWKDFDYTKHNFGLIPRSYPTDSSTTTTSPDSASWPRFHTYLQHLISTAPSDVTYKLLYLARHGEGYHNVAEAFYGTKAWDDHWSKLEGNGTLVWADAHLTDLGKDQARAAGEFLSREIKEGKMPVPQRWFVSPMFRCLQTADLTWRDLDVPFEPVIKELIREVLGEHTCDRRSSKTYIREHFPEWEIEEGFTEEDELWRADHRETHEEHDLRTTAFLTELFENDDDVYVSLTSHSGAIGSHLRAVGHRDFRLPTGGMIPVLVKATKIR